MADFNIGQSVVQALQAAGLHNFIPLIGIAVMVLVYLARRINVVSKLPSKAVPWATTGLSILGAMAMAVMSGSSLLDAVGVGINVAITAIGAWELAGQHIADKIEGQPASPPSPSEPPPSA